MVLDALIGIAVGAIVLATVMSVKVLMGSKK
jgi:orotate phosphoribosyltransferase